MRVRHSMLSQQLNHRVNNLQLEMTHLRGATYESLRPRGQENDLRSIDIVQILLETPKAKTMEAVNNGPKHPKKAKMEVSTILI